MRKILTLILAIGIFLGYCHGFSVEQVYAKDHSNTMNSECSQCIQDRSYNRVFVTYSDFSSKIKSLGYAYSPQITTETVYTPKFFVSRINSPPDHISVLKTVQQLE